MISGFPKRCIPALRCTHDGSTLLSEETDEDDGVIATGFLTCTSCRTRFPIDDGILNMLIGTSLDEESRHEQKLALEKQAGRYVEGGIFRYLFTIDEVRKELEPYFRKFEIRPIQAYLPFARKLRLPVLKDLGEFLLCTAEQPVV